MIFIFLFLVLGDPSGLDMQFISYTAKCFFAHYFLVDYPYLLFFFSFVGFQQLISDFSFRYGKMICFQPLIIA